MSWPRWVGRFASMVRCTRSEDFLLLGDGLLHLRVRRDVRVRVRAPIELSLLHVPRIKDESSPVLANSGTSSTIRSGSPSTNGKRCALAKMRQPSGLSRDLGATPLVVVRATRGRQLVELARVEAALSKPVRGLRGQHEKPLESLAPRILARGSEAAGRRAPRFGSPGAPPNRPARRCRRRGSRRGPRTRRPFHPARSP